MYHKVGTLSESLFHKLVQNCARDQVEVSTSIVTINIKNIKMQYVYVQNPSAIVEKLVYFLGLCSCIADVAGGEGQNYNLAAVVFYFLISENKSVIQYDRFWKFMVFSILLDIIFLASWPDRGAAVQTFASFGLISKVS